MCFGLFEFYFKTIFKGGVMENKHYCFEDAENCLRCGKPTCATCQSIFDIDGEDVILCPSCAFAHQKKIQNEVKKLKSTFLRYCFIFTFCALMVVGILIYFFATYEAGEFILFMVVFVYPMTIIATQMYFKHLDDGFESSKTISTSGKLGEFIVAPILVFTGIFGALKNYKLMKKDEINVQKAIQETINIMNGKYDD